MLLKMLQALVLLVSLENLLIRFFTVLSNLWITIHHCWLWRAFLFEKRLFTFHFLHIHSFILNSTHIRLLCGHQNVGKFIIAVSKYYITSCHNYRKYGGTLHSFSLIVLGWRIFMEYQHACSMVCTGCWSRLPKVWALTGLDGWGYVRSYTSESMSKVIISFWTFESMYWWGMIGLLY